MGSLPSEVLLNVFHHIEPDWSILEGPERLSYLLVARRWRGLCEPLIYKTIQLRCCELDNREIFHGVVLRLVRTLEQARNLRDHVRNVLVDLRYQCWPQQGAQQGRLCSDVFREASRLVQLCQRCEYVWLSATGVFRLVEPIITALPSLPRLNSLVLRGDIRGSDIKSFIGCFRSKTLDEVRIDFVRSGQFEDEFTIETWDDWSPDENIDKLLPPDQRRTAGIRSMELDGVWGTGLVARALLAWASRLEELFVSFDQSYYSYHGFDGPPLFNVLEGTCSSLRQLKFDCMTNITEDTIQNFSMFPSLEKLQLPLIKLLDRSPQTVCYSLSKLPKLRCLCLHLSFGIFIPLWSRYFEENTSQSVDWCFQFAKTLKSDFPSSMLEEINMEFQEPPEPSCFDHEGLGKAIAPWPWDYCEQVSAALMQHRLRAVYPKPTMSKEEWIETAKRTPKGSKRMIECKPRITST